jgi:hypothetical protein
VATNDFQSQVLEKLSALTVHQAELTSEVRNIVQRLDRLNGSVARHEEALNTLKLTEANRTGREQASGTWLKNLAPAGWSIIGAIIVLFLQHASTLLPFMK